MENYVCEGAKFILSGACFHSATSYLDHKMHKGSPMVGMKDCIIRKTLSVKIPKIPISYSIITIIDMPFRASSVSVSKNHFIRTIGIY